MRSFIAFGVLLLAAIATAQSVKTTKTVYVYAGAADIVQYDELASSHFHLGKSITSGDTVYDRPTTAAGTPVVLGLSARFCTEIYLDQVHDAAEYAVTGTYPNYADDHERHLTPTDNSRAGFGSYECSWTISLVDGTLSVKGELERRPAIASVVAITGGTGAYNNVRGTATITAVDANSCANTAFKATSLPASCQYKIVYNLITLTRVSPVTPITVFEYAGAQELTRWNENAASRFKLGDRELFGNPVTDGSTQIGYSGGVQYIVYLDSSDASYAAASSATGFHARPGAAGKGLRLAELSLVYFPSGDSVALQGLIESDLTLSSTLAIVGGTGRFQNAKGSAIRSTVDPARCASNAFQLHALVTDCIHRYDLNVIVNANDPFTDNAGGFVFYEYGGSTVSVNFQEVHDSLYGLGQSFYFGGPLKTDTPDNNGVRIGYDGGYCWKVYLDHAYDTQDLDSGGIAGGVRHLDGAHTRPGTLKWDGAWMCYWTSHYLEGSITQMGIFADSVSVPNLFSVVGGTGVYSNSTGFMFDELSNPQHCFVNGFSETSPVDACLYRKRYTLLSLAP
jgi:hypothetical protein